MAGGGVYDEDKNVLVKKGSNVADVIANSGLLGGTVRRVYDGGNQAAATAAQLQRKIVSGGRSGGQSRPSSSSSSRPSLPSAPRENVAGRQGKQAAEASRASSLQRRPQSAVLSRAETFPSHNEPGSSRRPYSGKQSARRSPSGPGVATVESVMLERKGMRTISDAGAASQAWEATDDDRLSRQTREEEDDDLLDEVIIESSSSGQQGGSDRGAGNVLADARWAIREKELRTRLDQTAAELAATRESAEGAHAEVAHLTEVVESLRGQMETCSSGLRKAEAATATAESARRNADRRAKGLEGELSHVRGQLEESRLQTDRLVAEAVESQKHWEKERSKHADTTKKLRAERKEDTKQAQTASEKAKVELQRTIDHLRRELNNREEVLEQLRQDMQEHRAAASAAAEARRRLEEDAASLREQLSAAKQDSGALQHQAEMKAALTMELTATAHIKAEKEATDRERQRAAELGTALRKANRQVAELRERHASVLADLEGRVCACEAQQKSTVQSLSEALLVAADKTTALLAGRKAGTLPPRRKQGQAAAGKSTALMVLEDMNEQLAAENAALLFKLAKLQAQAGQSTTDTKLAPATVAAAAREAVIMQKREILEDDLEDGQLEAESAAAGAINATEENLRLRVELKNLEAKATALRLAAEASQVEVSTVGERADQQLQNTLHELELARTARQQAQEQVQKLLATWHSPEAFQEETARVEAAKAALKAAKEEAQRKANALSAVKAEKQSRDGQLQQRIDENNRMETELQMARDEIRRKDIQITRLRTQLNSRDTDAASDCGSLDGSTNGARPPSARPPSASTGADYPRLKQQLADRDASLSRMAAEAEARTAEVDKLQVGLTKVRRQLSQRTQEKDSAIKALEEELRFTKETLGKQLEQERSAAEAIKAATASELSQVQTLREELSRTKKEADRARIEHDYVRQRMHLEGKKPKKPALGLCRAFAIGIKPG